MSLPNFCPSCADNRRTSGETLLSVPMVLEEFSSLRRVWVNENRLDISNGAEQAMRDDGVAARHKYARDTLGGPWNNAEWYLRENLELFRGKWESYIRKKKEARYEQERGPNWAQQSYWP